MRILLGIGLGYVVPLITSIVFYRSVALLLVSLHRVAAWGGGRRDREAAEEPELTGLTSEGMDRSTRNQNQRRLRLDQDRNVKQKKRTTKLCWQESIRGMLPSASLLLPTPSPPSFPSALLSPTPRLRTRT